VLDVVLEKNFQSNCCLYDRLMIITRKPCYRKDDRAMRPMDALKNFDQPWLRPRLLFPKLLMGFCCDRFDRIKVRTKLEVRSFTSS